MALSSGDWIAIAVSGAVPTMRWAFDRWGKSSAQRQRDARDMLVEDMRSGSVLENVRAQLVANTEAMQHIDGCVDTMKLNLAGFTARHEEQYKSMNDWITRLDRGLGHVQAQIRNVATDSNNRYTDEHGKDRI